MLPSWRAANDNRPELSGPEEVVTSADGQFAIHYTLEGEDAVQSDPDVEGLPETVQWTLEGLQIGVEHFQDRGYRSLIGDAGAGGDDAIDIYIKDINANGYAHPVDVGEAGSSCYIRLDNGLVLDGVMQSVTIHELHHCVEYRYTTQAAGWIYEATATFEQYRAHLDDALAIAVVVLYSRRLEDPQLPMDWTDGEFEYAGMVAMQFWEQYGGTDPSRVPSLWEALAAQPDWRDTLHEEAQRTWSLSWDQAFLEYATWNAFACANNDGSGYDETHLPCNEFVSVPMRPKEWHDGEATVRLKLDDPGYNADYWSLPDDQPRLEVEVACEAPRLAKSALTVRLVAVDAAGHRIDHGDANPDQEAPVARLTAPRDPGGSIHLIGANIGDGPVNVRCRLSQEPSQDTPRAGCGCDSSRSAMPGWLLPVLLVGLRRRIRGSRPDSANSSRSWPR